KEGAAACPGSRVAVADLEGHVVGHIRALGRDPKLVALTIKAAKTLQETRRPELEAELKRVEADRRKLPAERENLVSAIGAGGSGTQALVARLREVEKRLPAMETS